jgi:IS30 family transposase
MSAMDIDKKEKILELARAKHSVRDIAQEVGCAASTVHRQLREHQDRTGEKFLTDYNASHLRRKLKNEKHMKLTREFQNEWLRRKWI